MASKAWLSHDLLARRRHRAGARPAARCRHREQQAVTDVDGRLIPAVTDPDGDVAVLLQVERATQARD